MKVLKINQNKNKNLTVKTSKKLYKFDKIVYL